MSILDTIDAALSGRCPCGAVLGPDSPSLDWCSPACQQRWFERQARDPRDVYAQPDAVLVLELERAGLDEPSSFLAAHTRAVEAGAAIDRAMLGEASGSPRPYFHPAVIAAITAPVDLQTILRGITVV